MSLEALASYTDGPKLVAALRAAAEKTPGALTSDGSADSFIIGYMAAYIAELNRQAIEAEEAEPRPLSDSEIDELLVNVSISKLERLLGERRRELADTPEEIDETLESGIFGDVNFPKLNGGKS